MESVVDFAKIEKIAKELHKVLHKIGLIFKISLAVNLKALSKLKHLCDIIKNI